jgi:hypothetical protein
MGWDINVFRQCGGKYVAIARKKTGNKVVMFNKEADTVAEALLKAKEEIEKRISE